MAVDKFTASDGIRLAYYIDDYTDPWRQADTLLLLHAAVGHAKRFYAWVPALCRHYRVVRLDLRGHGASEVPPASSTLDMDRLVADVEELLDPSRRQVLPYRRQFGRRLHRAEPGDEVARQGEEPDAVRLDRRAARTARPRAGCRASPRKGCATSSPRPSPTACRSTRCRRDCVDWFVDEAAKNDPAWITRFVGLMSSLEWSDKARRDQVPDPARHAGRRDRRLDQELRRHDRAHPGRAGDHLRGHAAQYLRCRCPTAAPPTCSPSCVGASACRRAKFRGEGVLHGPDHFPRSPHAGSAAGPDRRRDPADRCLGFPGRHAGRRREGRRRARLGVRECRLLLSRRPRRATRADRGAVRRRRRASTPSRWTRSSRSGSTSTRSATCRSPRKAPPNAAAQGKKPSQNEAFFLRRERSADDPDVIAGRRFHVQNQWPAEPAGLPRADAQVHEHDGSAVPASWCGSMRWRSTCRRTTSTRCFKVAAHDPAAVALSADRRGRRQDREPGAAHRFRLHDACCRPTRCRACRSTCRTANGWTRPMSRTPSW